MRRTSVTITDQAGKRVHGAVGIAIRNVMGKGGAVTTIWLDVDDTRALYAELAHAVQLQEKEGRSGPNGTADEG